MRNRNREDLIPLVIQSELRISVLDTNANRSRDELKAGVSKKRTREQSCLAGDLKAIADADDRLSAARVCNHFVHDWTEPRNRAGTQVVAIAEPAGKNHDVRALKVVILVPQVHSLFAERVYHG